jgi:hypothetical protein
MKAKYSAKSIVMSTDLAMLIPTLKTKNEEPLFHFSSATADGVPDGIPPLVFIQDGFVGGEFLEFLPTEDDTAYNIFFRHQLWKAVIEDTRWDKEPEWSITWHNQGYVRVVIQGTCYDKYVIFRDACKRTESDAICTVLLTIMKDLQGFTESEEQKKSSPAGGLFPF